MELDPKTVKAALARTRACATPAQLDRLLRADRAGGDDARVAEHVAGCIRCRSELALLRDFEAAEPRLEEEADARWIAQRLERDLDRITSGAPAIAKQAARRASPWRVATRVAAGIAAVAAIAIVAIDLGRTAHPPPVLTDQMGGSTPLRSAGVTLVAPKGDVDGAPAELRWDAVPGAASYSVELMEVDRTPIWRVEARQPATLLPPDIRGRMVAGAPHLWQVVARDAAGEAIATSTVQRFRAR